MFSRLVDFVYSPHQMQTEGHVKLEKILDVATQARVPVLLWGPPGVGKSAAIQRWAVDRGMRCWTVIASLREPSDFAGLPIVDPVDDDQVGRTIRTVSFAPPRFAVEAAEHGGVIFLDELTTAPPAVQAALLRAVIDRTLGLHSTLFSEWQFLSLARWRSTADGGYTSILRSSRPGASVERR